MNSRHRKHTRGREANSQGAPRHWLSALGTTMSRLGRTLGALVTVSLLTALTVTPALAQPAFPPGLQQAIAAQERHTPALLGVPGVVGTAVGLGASGAPVVKIYTDSPGVAGLPHVVDGVPVVVEFTGPIVARHHSLGHSGGPGGGGDAPAVDTTARFAWPVPIGVSTGHPDITAGTIGARVKDASNNVYALSNNHVYAASNEATIGDNVLQPGPVDGGVNPDDRIGTLYDFEPIVFSILASNEFDAAIAVALPGALGNATPSNGYGTPRSTAVAAAIAQRVQKYGRTTGLTSGRVDAINAIVNVGYGAPGTARFVKQIVVKPGTFSAGGDSGSLVVAKGDRSPVGLLFAGSPAVTIVSPIQPVLERFDVTIDGQP